MVLPVRESRPDVPSSVLGTLERNASFNITNMSKGLVLVTGANGYIAGRTIEAFLKAGYSVRGTVRSMSKAKGLLEALSEYADNLEIVQVRDITMHAAFDTAMRGMSSLPEGFWSTTDVAQVSMQSRTSPLPYPSGPRASTTPLKSGASPLRARSVRSSRRPSSLASRCSCTCHR